MADQSKVIVTETGIERRFIAGEVRVIEGQGEERPRIRGYGAVFNEWSEDLGWFIETIAPGAFNKTVQEADVRSLWNHNVDYVLGRNKSGTLRLFIDEQGLGYEVEPPDAQWARDLMASIRRGDVTGSSFGFDTIDDELWTDENNKLRRRLKEVRLYDVGPVTFPAYPQTTSEMRAKADAFAAPGQEPHADEGDEGEGDSAQERLEIQRRRLDIAEIEFYTEVSDESA